MKETNSTLNIHEKILHHDLLGAVEEIEKISEKYYSSELLMLKSRISTLKRIEIKRTQSKESIEIERSDIINSILQLLEMVNLTNTSLKEDKGEIPLIEDLTKIIDITFNTWKAQCKLRDNLVELLESRIDDLEYETKYDLLANCYEQMNGRELRLHKAIRGYTQNIILPKNIEALKILKDHSYLKDTIPQLKYLEQHLLLWKSKYDSIFADDKSVCLIYVGIEEEMKFPPDLLNELKKYLEDKRIGGS